jgi:hypothetical protein
MPAPNEQGSEPREPLLAETVETLAQEAAAAIARIRAHAAWMHATITFPLKPR